ncbi:MAG: thymidylate synthase [Chloroflexota bacterium]|nr:thymidylate synthase [Chloroflexota bacterium]
MSKSTISQAWVESLNLFFRAKEPYRFDSSMGPCIELDDVLLEISSPLRSPQVSNLYPEQYRPLIEDFTDKLAHKQEGRVSATNARLYAWPMPDNKTLDQVATQLAHLEENPETRHCTIAFWNPALDNFSETPVSPLLANYRFRSGKLHSTVVARSVDAWIGALPIIIAFANLQDQLAQAASMQVGPLRFLALSYHLYETYVPVVASALEGGVK